MVRVKKDEYGRVHEVELDLMEKVLSWIGIWHKSVDESDDSYVLSSKGVPVRRILKPNVNISYSQKNVDAVITIAGKKYKLDDLDPELVGRILKSKKP